MAEARPLRVVMAAGGTAGHIEPALNVADELRRRRPDAQVTVIGSDRGMESTLVPARGYELITVPAVPMPRRPSTDLLLVGPRVRDAVGKATAALDRLQAQAVVGFGGYAAVPPYLAARRRHIPLFIHEANAKAGIANRLGARFTSHVYENVPGSMRAARHLGMPLRPAIANLDRAGLRAQARASFGLPTDAPVLLVFGGSQGAASINDALAEALPRLRAAGIAVLHAHGSRNAALAPADGWYLPVAFIDRMDLAYAAADLALCRAGAMTVAELTAVGLPAIYVPLPIGNGEQRLNAQPVVDAGGGLLIDNADLTASRLADAVLGLLDDGDVLRSMSAAASALGVRDASQVLVDDLLAVLDGTGR